MKNIQKLIASKPVKHNKNTLLFLLSFSKSQYKKNIEKTFFVSAGAQKVWETPGSGNTLPQYSPNSKKKKINKKIQ